MSLWTRQTCRSAVYGALCPATGICARVMSEGGQCQPGVAKQATLPFVFNICLNVDLHNMFQLFSPCNSSVLWKTVFLRIQEVCRDPSRHGRVSSALHVVRAPVCPRGEPPTNSDRGVLTLHLELSLATLKNLEELFCPRTSQTPQSFCPSWG